MVKQQGGKTFIDVESGGWLMHAPCLMRRVPNPGRQTPHLRLLKYFSSFTNVFNKSKANKLLKQKRVKIFINIINPLLYKPLYNLFKV
jgi:hypothetical protein